MRQQIWQYRIFKKMLMKRHDNMFYLLSYIICHQDPRCEETSLKNLCQELFGYFPPFLERWALVWYNCGVASLLVCPLVTMSQFELSNQYFKITVDKTRGTSSLCDKVTVWVKLPVPKISRFIGPGTRPYLIDNFTIWVNWFVAQYHGR